MKHTLALTDRSLKEEDSVSPAGRYDTAQGQPCEPNKPCLPVIYEGRELPPTPRLRKSTALLHLMSRNPGALEYLAAQLLEHIAYVHE